MDKQAETYARNMTDAEITDTLEIAAEERKRLRELLFATERVEAVLQRERARRALKRAAAI